MTFFNYSDIVNTLYSYYLYWNQLSSSCRGLDHHIYLLPRTVWGGSDNASLVFDQQKKKRNGLHFVFEERCQWNGNNKSSVERRCTVSSAVYCMEMTGGALIVSVDWQTGKTKRPLKSSSPLNIVRADALLDGVSRGNKQCEIMCSLFMSSTY